MGRRCWWPTVLPVPKNRVLIPRNADFPFTTCGAAILFLPSFVDFSPLLAGPTFPYATPPRPHSCLYQTRRHDYLFKKVSTDDAAACGLVHWREGTIILHLLPVQLQPSAPVTTAFSESAGIGTSTWKALTIACTPAVPARAGLALWGCGYTLLWIYTHSAEPLCARRRMVNT